jgi:choline dehydrogenase-like flavoprotein
MGCLLCSRSSTADGNRIPDDKEEQILIPGLIGTTRKIYDWDIMTQPIPGLNNNTFPIASAKVVGGGTVINGMFFDRGSKWDYDSWEQGGTRGGIGRGLSRISRRRVSFSPGVVGREKRC